ncbi:MAG TPA: phosphate propanoyltransferase [Gemmataceae bacterium]|nr:phosphate propanoyltransferase [Gemmataceae bacterium]
MTVATTTIDRSQVEKLVRSALAKVLSPAQTSGASKLVANISARHCHLTQPDVERLFGEGHKLRPMKYLYQDGEFASEESLTIIGPRQRIITGLRILGPCRSASQVELAFTDGIALGIDLPVRISGDHHDTPGCWLMGPAGMIELKQGVIRAERHVHMGTKDAEFYGVKHMDKIHLRVGGRCPTVLEDLLCRVDPRYKLEIHLDTDEGNACNLQDATGIELFK